ncbi:hypothetical protein X777_13953 [Ooceraea biroi]|uniref:Uncharacterized protein n=1 Tax=Ooceraea biroi TaxID=2015173 RepID=A0A026WY16_OOCBI|nr:hypothetical protein X777_13953 [Ooceraea biroi]
MSEASSERIDEYASTVKFLTTVVPPGPESDEKVYIYEKIFPYLFKVYKRELSRAEVMFWHKTLQGNGKDVKSVSDSVKRNSEELRGVIETHEELAKDPQLTLKKLEAWKQDSLRPMLHFDLYKQVAFSRIIPQKLSNDDKYERKKFCQDMKNKFEKEGLDKALIVACDEIYLDYIKNKEDIEESGPSTAKKMRFEGSEVKLKDQDDTMVVVFFDSYGIILKKFVQKRELNAEYSKLLEQVSQDISKEDSIRYHQGKSWYLLHDDTPLLRTPNVRQTLANEKIILLPLPWFSPDLSACRFLYPKLKAELEENFINIEDLKNRVETRITAISPKECHQFITKDLFNYFVDVCDNQEGDYFVTEDFVSLGKNFSAPSSPLSNYVQQLLEPPQQQARP